MSGTIYAYPKERICAHLSHAVTELERARMLTPIPGDKDQIDSIIEKVKRVAAQTEMMGD